MSRPLAKFFSLLFAMVLAPVAFANMDCPSGYARFNIANPAFLKGASPFWMQEAVPLTGHPGRFFTFSIDSEISFAQGLRFLRKFPELEATIQEQFRSLLSRNELLIANGVGDKQLGMFVLRKGVDPRQGYYTYADLQPNAFMNTLYYQSRGNIKLGSKSAEAMAGIFNKLVEREGWPFKAHADGHNVEFSHQTFETSPRNFYQQVQTFEKNFDAAQTHLHVGIPAEVNQEEFMQILRALEARMTLRIARENTGNKMAFADSSFLHEYPLNGLRDRGMLKGDLKEWSTPFDTHNLEIREHFTLQEAFDNAELAVTLAQERRRLKYFPGVFRNVDEKIDERIGNIHGALKYAEAVLAKSPLSEDRKLIAELSQLVKLTKPKPVKDYSEEYKVSAEIRERVARFLARTHLDERLNADRFLRAP